MSPRLKLSLEEIAKPMKKFAMLMALVFVAGVAMADESKKADATKPGQKTAKAEAAKPGQAATKTHEVDAEIVSVDAQKKTVTIKGEKENKTVPVDEKAFASVKALKAGEKVTLICRDNEKGEHQAVAGVKAAPKAGPAEKK